MTDLDEKLLEKMLADDEFAEFMEMPAAVSLAIPERRREDWIQGERNGRPMLGLAVKRHYDIKKGKCIPRDGAGEPLNLGEVKYFNDDEIMRHAPIFCADDYKAGRELTDVVIQGGAHAYDDKTTQTTATVRIGSRERSIEVFGERRGDFDRSGKPLFTPPGRFDVVPLRYDFAYGGVALMPLYELLGSPDPDEPVEIPDETPFHYPRNPCGLGYILDVDFDNFQGLELPYLEHPFERLGPERMAIGDELVWPYAPLPACWDWQSEIWFPRCGYQGIVPEHLARAGKPIAEVRKGWVDKDILELEPFFRTPDVPLRSGFAQGASAGMSFDDIAPDQHFELEHIHPKRPLWSFDLSGEVPKMAIDLGGPSLTQLQAPHMCSVCIRPGRDEVLVVWAAWTEVDHTYEELEVLDMKRTIDWETAS